MKTQQTERRSAMKGFRYGVASVVVSLISIFVLLVHPALAADLATTLADSYLKKKPVAEADTGLTLDQAMKVQKKYLAILGKTEGKVVGYKAGLTNPSVQKVFGVTAPVRGTLLKSMLLESGAVLPADFGALPLSEGDLILRVGSDKINKAKTPEETLKYIDAAIPFIELPDLMYARGVKINGPALVAVNVGARYGIVGKPIPIQPTKEWSDRLKDFTLRILDEKGTMVVEGKGSNLLDHPLNVVLWIKNSLQAEGKKLRKGDLLSLGTITKLMPTKPDTEVRARYIGLDPKGPVEIFVKFKADAKK
jgi:2-keto-4-pentenoate hydratase